MEKRHSEMLICQYVGKVSNGIILNVWKEEDEEPVAVTVKGIEREELKIAIDSKVKAYRVGEVVKDILQHKEVIGFTSIEVEYRSNTFKIQHATQKKDIAVMLVKSFR